MRRRMNKIIELTGMKIKEWKRRLAVDPDNVIAKIIRCTTQQSMQVERESRSIARKHRISRFPILKKYRRDDIVHSNKKFPSIRSAQGHTCSQVFIGEKKYFMHVELMKSESCSALALQDFTRKYGTPHTIKTCNTRIEIGTNWTEHYYRLHTK